MGNRVYIGGDFTTLIGHTGRSSRVSISRRSMRPPDRCCLGTRAPTAPVYSLAASPDGTRIYAGGQFRFIGGQARTRLAAIDADTGIPVAWTPSVSAIVRTIVASGSRVYIGGEFDFVTGQGQPVQARARLAALDANNGTLVTGWNPSANGNARDMVMTPDNRLIVVGGFTTIGGNPSAYLAPLDPTTGTILPWASRPATPAFGVALGPSQLFVAMAGVGNNAAIAYNLATGAQQWSMAADGDVNDVTYLNGIVYAGGHFDVMAGQTRRRLAAFNATSGTLRTDWAPAALDSGPVGVGTMLAAGNRLYIGGDFETVAGVTRLLFASFSGPPAANTPPVVDSVTIDQASPRTADTLSVTVTSHDADGEPGHLHVPVVPQRHRHLGCHGRDAQPGDRQQRGQGRPDPGARNGERRDRQLGARHVGAGHDREHGPDRDRVPRLGLPGHERHPHGDGHPGRHRRR